MNTKQEKKKDKVGQVNRIQIKFRWSSQIWLFYLQYNIGRIYFIILLFPRSNEYK